jgi:hypothetical protein
VPPEDIGTASGAFTSMRQLGGAFGVAVLGAVFAAAGSYSTPAAFSRGFAAALAVAASLALVGAAAGTILPGRRDRPAATATPGAGGAGAASAPSARYPVPVTAGPATPPQRGSRQAPREHRP